eukprot:gnl/TRDRNA2_/TRDRNA2_142307_c1_seq1.p1 gnl/TRDRNA2_/TRDRNA2_142307_c1~~gnl/TRDRNA2_/TRDRNA2_142307_c1_seq1.p1  ORF type:complete len:213 (-),score=22.64 gnl/TRDRNA2_/TRDRNA2_142307_c1_seq1:117-731(-)
MGTPVAAIYVNPRLESICQRFGMHFHCWMRFIIGITFGYASAFTAAHFEVMRRAAPSLSITSNCAPQGVGVKAVSAYWMLIPYCLMGISTIYTVPSIMMAAYRQVPKTMRSLTVVTNLFMVSASQSMVMSISLLTAEYTPHDLDSGNLEYLYFCCIGLSLFCLAVFSSILPNFQEQYFDDTTVDQEDDTLGSVVGSSIQSGRSA